MTTKTKNTTTLLAACVLAASAHAGSTETFTETFDAFPTEGTWSWGAGDFINPKGGNPGAYLATDTLATFAPTARTRNLNAHQFNGDFRARGVTKFSIDLITHVATFGAGGRRVAQDRNLGARRIIFRKRADAREQMRACRVVEIFRRYRLLRHRQARQHVVQEGPASAIERT